VCPEDWQDYSDANINKAERERQSSVDLRSLVDGILQQTSNDMRKQCSEVNFAFQKRIKAQSISSTARYIHQLINLQFQLLLSISIIDVNFNY
jgi:tektin-1